MKIKFANLDFTPKEINESEHSLRAVFSTDDVDRHGEVVDQKSWILDDFLKNPVVLFGHDHSQPPVGKITGLGYNSQGNLEGEVKFAAQEYPFAKVIWNLYKGGFMKAFSVGFSAGKVDVVDNQVILRDNTLYEISTVAVPANAMALAKAKGFDMTALEEKMVEQDSKTGETKEKCATCESEEKGCPCKDKKPDVEPAAAAPAKEEPAKEEAKAAVTTEETTVKEVEVTKEAGDEAVMKGIDALVTSLKEGRVLSKKNRKAIEDAIVALNAILEADKKEEGDKQVVRANSTALSIKVETPAVRIAVPAKGQNKAKLINKAIRALLAEKRKV